jgi:hypothetical protein
VVDFPESETSQMLVAYFLALVGIVIFQTVLWFYLTWAIATGRYTQLHDPQTFFTLRRFVIGIVGLAVTVTIMFGGILLGSHFFGRWGAWTGGIGFFILGINITSAFAPSPHTYRKLDRYDFPS